MNETDKLRVLIPHWIEHNQEHAQEFRDWAAQAGDASADILSASEIMDQHSIRDCVTKVGWSASLPPLSRRI